MKPLDSHTADQKVALEHFNFLKLNVLIAANITITHLMIFCSLYIEVSSNEYISLAKLIIVGLILISFMVYSISCIRSYNKLEIRYSCPVNLLLQSLFINKTMIMLCLISNSIVFAIEMFDKIQLSQAMIS